MGGSESLGYNQSESQSSQRDLGTNVYGPQQLYLEDLWSRARTQSMAPSAGVGQMDQASATLGRGTQQLGAANDLLYGMAAPGASNPQLTAYGNQVGRMFNEQILPGLSGSAQQVGQLGSSRAGLAQASAAGAAQRSLQDFAGEQYQQDMARQLAAAQSLQQGGGMYGQMAQLYGQLGQAAANAPWQNLQQYSALLGGPVMQNLGGYGDSSSDAWGFTQSGSFSMKG